MPDVSGVVLAGGQSRRLGTNKAFVKVGGVALIDRVLHQLGQLSDDVLIVTNDPVTYQGLGVSVVEDAIPGGGSLGGIYTGLALAGHERAVAVGCDMPFLDLGLLRFMILLSEKYDVVIPSLEGLLEPLHAVYSKACLGPMADVLQAGGRRIVDFFPQVRVRHVERAELEALDPEHLSFFNINTPEDLSRAQALAACGKPRS